MFPSLSWLCRGKHLLANQVTVGTTPHPVLRFNCAFLTLCFVWSHFPERAGVDMKRFILFKSSGWASEMAGCVCGGGYSICCQVWLPEFSPQTHMAEVENQLSHVVL